MSINSQFAVAIHILTLLAIEEKPLTSKFISQSVNTNPVVVRRIVGALQEANMVKTIMGADGGTKLTQDPQTITLLDVFRATGQGDALVLPNAEPNADCPCGANIQPAMLPFFDRAQAAMEDELAHIHLSEVVSNIQKRIAAGGSCGVTELPI